MMKLDHHEITCEFIFLQELRTKNKTTKNRIPYHFGIRVGLGLGIGSGLRLGLVFGFWISVGIVISVWVGLCYRLGVTKNGKVF